ncbi:MAG TPA: type II secretion system protein GspL [Wenzhouxiangellaceae bacterium]|nr:type II secretion system protein GspL [Wenzhouxiangellaceae bacterium]
MARSERYRLIHVVTGEVAVFAGIDGHIGPAQDAGAEADLVALVPADRCSLVRVDLPEMSGSRMSQALRWAVEDSIAGDPEQQHVVPVRRAGDGRLLCLVVARDDMDQWLAALPERPSRLVPDAACLPRADDEVVLMQLGDFVLAHGGNDMFDRIEPELLDSLVPEFTESVGAQGRLVWLGDKPPAEIDRFAPEKRSGGASALALLAPAALGSSGAAFNLLQGEYAERDRASAARQWRLTGWLAGLAAFLLLTGALAEYTMLKREQLRLEQAVEARFAELFPDISAIVRPRAQAERALAELRGGSRDRFVQLLGAVSPLFSGARGIEVTSISYIDGTLELELETSSLADLEALQRQLRAQGIGATLQNIEVLSGSTRARIRISGDST